MILDAGPLVALLNARDRNHAWTVDQLKRLSGPIITCEAVLSEAFFLLRNTAGGTARLVGMLRSGGLEAGFSLGSELERVCALLSKYADVPMSLADACLVRMSELSPRHLLMTFDADFRFYRRNRSQTIPIITP